MIVERGKAIGLDWDGDLEELRQQDWAAAVADITNPGVTFPSYYM